jgi:peroxiredoxin
VKTILGTLLLAVFALGVLAFVSVDTQAAASKTLPNFEMRGLDESEHRLSDAQYKDKIVLIAAFSTWQDISIKQARELQAFHVKHPEVEIIAFVSDDAPAARDFVARQGLTYACFKSNGGPSGDGSPKVSQNFNRLFETKKGKTLTLNKIPFVVLAAKDRRVAYANVGLTSEATMSEQLAGIK